MITPNDIDFVRCTFQCVLTVLHANDENDTQMITLHEKTGKNVLDLKDIYDLERIQRYNI